jgi:hypothetical protein
MWEMIYISGKPGFINNLFKQLQHADIATLPGSTEGSQIAAIWVLKGTDLRELKIALGSKFVFKYRLRFFQSYSDLTGIEEPKPQQNFTKNEREMIRKMIAREEVQLKIA